MCLFCDIAECKIPSTKVYENDYVLCFNDINPVAPVHVLVVPKKHFANMNELASDPEGALYSAEITKAVAEVAKIKGTEDAYRTINNCNATLQRVLLCAGTHDGPPSCYRNPASTH